MNKVNVSTDKGNKIKNYIANGKVVFDVTITNDEDKNHTIVTKWVVNDRWCRDAICAELKNDDSGMEVVYLCNSNDLANRFGGVDGIKRDVTNLFKNDKRINGIKIF